MSEHVVRSPVAGTVWRIEAGVGRAVSEQDAIIILESMKMEIPVVAARNGTVARILVDEGDAIGVGQDLAIIVP